MLPPPHSYSPECVDTLLFIHSWAFLVCSSVPPYYRFSKDFVVAVLPLLQLCSHWSAVSPKWSSTVLGGLVRPAVLE